MNIIKQVKTCLFLGLFVFVASACGGLTQDAPPATKSKAKVSLVLPQGVSLKPGGVIESGNPKLHAATITGITLSVSAPDITIPVTGDIPLDTLMLSLDIPSGLARTFTVAVTTDTAGSFAGSQTVDLAADAAIDVAIAVTLVNIPTAPTGVSIASGDGQAVLSWTAVTGADTYNVYYGTAGGVTTATGTKVAGATSGAAITGLANGTAYYFVVTAVNTAGESAPSAEASATPQVPAPAAPTGVSTTGGNGQAVLSWAASGTASSYNIYRSTASGTLGALIGTSATNGYTDATAANGTTYYYTITAVNAGGESAASLEVSTMPQIPTPGVPAGITVTGGNAQVLLSWTAVTGAASYNVYYGTTASVTTVNGTKVAGATSGGSITGLANGTAYYFIVTAVNAGGESVVSSEVSVMPQVPSPGAPTGIGVTAGDGQATISWTAVTGATSYNVYYRTTAGVTTGNGTKVTGATNGGAITGLTNGTTYYFVVTAVNAGGESAVSSEVSATPLPPVPVQPTGVTAVGGNAQVVLSWTAVPGAVSYKLLGGQSPSAPSWSTSPVSTTTFTYTAASPGIVNGTTYYFQVIAVDNYGRESVPSIQTSATPVAPPATPTGISASAGNALVTVSWIASSGAASYNVYYRTTTGVTTANGTKITGATSGGAITGLVNGTPYYFVVTAVNASGESVVSGEVSATPQVPAPGIPGVLAATPGSAQVGLNWTAVTAIPNATITYTVYRSTVSGTVGAAIASSISVLSYTDTTAVNGTTYYYNVAAADAGGTSGASSQAAATPQVPTPGIPAGLAATAGNTQVGLTWTAVAAVPNATITYTVYRSTSSGTLGAAIASSISAASYTDTTAVNGTTYYYNVAAADAGGTSAASAQASATPQVPAPATPGGLVAIAGNAEVVLTWTAVTAIPNATITYTVYRSTVIGSQGTAIASAVSPATYTDSTAVNGTTYYYRIVAVDAGGSSAVSSQVSAVPQVPVPGAPRFAYVANEFSNTVSVYTINQTTGALTAGTAVAAGTWPVSVTVDPSGKFAYVANTGSNDVSVYTINQTTGALTAGTAVAARTNPQWVTVDPSGKFVYVANNGSSNVSVYTINQTTGALTAGTAVAAGTNPYSVAVDPSGKFAYVANQGGTVSVYTINQTTGALTAGTAVAAGTNPYTVTVDPSGKFAYVANGLSNNVSVYTIDQTTGVLTAGTAVAAGTWPVSVTVDPSGKFAYVANATSNNISVYAINQTTGALTAGTVVPAGNHPVSVTVDPSGKFAYAANAASSNVSVYTINQTTGALTAGTAVVAGAQPIGVVVTAGVAKPLAPGGVSATAGNTQTTLSWTYVAGATSYNVYHRTTTGVTIANGTKVTGATSGGAITGLANGTPYYFVVTAVNASGESAVSSEVSATPQVPAPSAPTSPSATAGNGQVTLSWTAPAGTVISYNVYYGTATGVSTASTKITGATNGGAITGLTNGTPYYFVVTAVNASGESAVSSEVSATPQVPAPSAPTSPSATAGNGQVTLSWTAPAGTVISYNVYYGTATGVSTASTKITGVTNGGAITGLTNGTPYYFVVTAVNATGESVISSEVSAAPIAPPVAPPGVTPTAGSGSVAIAWTAVGTASSYNIYRSTTSGVLGTVIGTSGTNSYTDSTAVNGTTYYYTITAVNAGGESVAGTAVSATPQVSVQRVPDTGQTLCYDSAGSVIVCAGTGQDGAYTINPPSYTDNGNGTITDNVTGMMWQKQDDATARDWTTAGTYCTGLSLGGYADWRLPSAANLQSIVDYGTFNPAINATYFPGTRSSYYWSSTTYATNTTYAWLVYFNDGSVTNLNNTYTYYARCVRLGQ